MTATSSAKHAQHDALLAQTSKPAAILGEEHKLQRKQLCCWLHCCHDNKSGDHRLTCEPTHTACCSLLARCTVLCSLYISMLWHKPLSAGVVRAVAYAHGDVKACWTTPCCCSSRNLGSETRPPPPGAIACPKLHWQAHLAAFFSEQNAAQVQAFRK